MTTDSENPKGQERNPVEEHLEQQFQQLGAASETPEDLKAEVFNTMDTLALFGDLLDLFTVKFTETKVQLLGVATPDIVEGEETTDEAIPEKPSTDDPTA